MRKYATWVCETALLLTIIVAVGLASAEGAARDIVIMVTPSLDLAASPAGVPYPASEVIKTVEWAPPATIVRKACDSDNWPVTWADDDNLYTAYGDGWGFDPRVDTKLSLGFARIVGGPEHFKGVNIRSETGERLGQDVSGAKASGVLCVDGILYMLVRNVGNSQIVWSDDHALAWHWCDWKFQTSFGAPTFLNFGRNYAGKRDDFVYVHSHDSDSAYSPADRMVLARVPLDRIRDRKAYEFLRSVDAAGRPEWTGDIRRRGAVFVNTGRCFRSGISVKAGRPWRWLSVSQASCPRFEGGTPSTRPSPSCA